MSFVRLQIRLLDELNLDVENFKRTYASIQMRGSGAFTWTANLKGSDFQICSTVTATDLLKQTKINILDASNNYGFFEII